MYAIGTSPYDLVKIKNDILFCLDKTKDSKIICILYDIRQNDCSLYINKNDAKEVMKDIKDKNNIVNIINGSIFGELDLELGIGKPPKIEDLKIYEIELKETD